MTAPWIEGLLTALAASTGALLVHEVQGWPLPVRAWHALAAVAHDGELRWWWIAWGLALVALARQGARASRA